MKKFITLLFSLAVASFAENVQILEPTGADFSPDGPTVVKSVLRAAVSQSGNTPVEGNSEIQLRTSIMTMGGYYLVVCEQVKAGAVVTSSKQKSADLSELDVAIERATVAALASLNPNATANADLVDEAAAPKKEPLPVNTSVVTVEYEEKPAPDTLGAKRPTRNYNSFGLGVALWHDYDYSADPDNEDDKDVDRRWRATFVFHYARVFEVSTSAAITITNNVNAVVTDGWEIHDAFLIGGRYYIQSGSVSPYIGAGLGLGFQFDNRYEEIDEYLAFGIACGAEAGVVFFRNSTMQLELGATWDAVWDGFSSFDRRFGSGSIYIALNY